MSYKLGSLFDGSGGFPLAGALCGIDPRWASEVEPYPIAVTRERFDGNADSPFLKIARMHFPDMALYSKHLGNICEIHGGEVEPVDVITFGSPCQDLSVAGKRAGLKHETNGDGETTRSGLFMEAVRIIREMREATDGEYPSFALWENVPGAFSSNGGEDFRVVCEELIKIVEPSAVMPDVPKAGWAYADSYRGDGWSLAYRVFDAQYWGVPQRRRRIHLVLDLRGGRAREVLFEREGVRGYFAPCGEARQTAPADAERSTGADDRAGEVAGGIGINGETAGTLDASDFKGCGMRQGIEREVVAVPYTMKMRAGCEGGGKGALIQKDKSATLATTNDQYLFQPTAYSFDSLASNSMKSSNPHSGCREVEVSKTLDCTDPNPSKNQGGIAIVQPMAIDGYNQTVSDKPGALRAGRSDGDHVGIVCVKEQHLFENHLQDTRYKGPLDISPMLPAQLGMGGNNTPFVVENQTIPIHDQATRFAGKRGDKFDGKGNGLGVGSPGDSMNTLTSADRHAVAYRQGGFADYVEGEVGTLKASGGDLGGGSENLICEKKVRYIVRRLTPTECARLQGFADAWGHIEQKDTLTDEEYRFWLEVRNTHAAINGKAVKEYTKPQMLTWYNKLWTDSAEYKMWGNGIALPPALYCMQGIADALGASIPITAEEFDKTDKPVERAQIICMATQQGGAEVRTDDMAPTLTAAAGMSGNNQPVVCYCEPTDLSDAPEEIKAEIIENAEILENRETEKNTTEENRMEQKPIMEYEPAPEQDAAPETVSADFIAAAQLRRIAEERKALAKLRPDDSRFADDVRALEFAVSVLEAVGL